VSVAAGTCHAVSDRHRDGPLARCAACPRVVCRRHRQRGLCARCYTRARVAETVTEYRPARRGSADVVAEVAELEAMGASREEVAARLGIRWHAVLAAHRRCGVPVPGRLYVAPAWTSHA
jgi:hypothetical protein